METEYHQENTEIEEIQEEQFDKNIKQSTNKKDNQNSAIQQISTNNNNEEQINNEIGFSQDLLKIYYEEFFPSELMEKWLTCCQGNEFSDSQTLLKRREIAFTLQDDIYCRFQSFSDAKDLKTNLIKGLPIKIDIGAVYNVPPKEKNSIKNLDGFYCEEKEFVIDIDMTDYDPVRTCCQEANICSKCWKFMRVACQLLDEALREDFGFQNLIWVYSGRRGIHCWVSDPSTKILNNEGRSAVINYLSLIQGNEKSGSNIKPKILRKHLHPAVKRAIDYLEKHFEEIVLKDQDLLNANNDKQQEKILKIVDPDQSLQASILNRWITEGDTSLKKWQILKQEINQWKQQIKKTEKLKSQKDRLPKRDRKRIKYLIQEIIITFLYPRLDVKVSTDMGHLLKSPFCIHPKTGKVCVPINKNQIDKFDPDNVPTLQKLVQEYDSSIKNNNNNQRNSLTPYLVNFTEYIKNCESDYKKLQTQRKKITNSFEMDY